MLERVSASFAKATRLGARLTSKALVAALAALPLLCAATTAVEAQTPTLRVVYPTEGSVLTTRDFTMLYEINGERQPSRLDHVHWQLSEGYNQTAADLGGAIDISSPRDGEHTLIVYMATPEHVPINGKLSVHFQIVTQGAAILAPSIGATSGTNDVELLYNVFGEIPEQATAKLTLDGGVAQVDGQLSGKFSLPSLRDGAHSVALWLEDSAGSRIGEVKTRAWTVRTTLNATNVKKAYALAKSIKSERSTTKRNAYFKSLGAVLKALAAGGAVNPTSPKLKRAAVLSVQKAYDSAKRKPTDKKLLASLESKLALLAKAAIARSAPSATPVAASGCAGALVRATPARTSGAEPTQCEAEARKPTIVWSEATGLLPPECR